jgi:hypothetical protein
MKISFISKGFPTEFECRFHFPTGKTHILKIVHQLDSVGFFSNLTQSEKHNTINKMIKYNDIFIDETKRFATLDAEDIDEGMCIREIKYLLNLPSIQHLFSDSIEEKDDTCYCIILLNNEFILWDYNEPCYKQNPWHVVFSRSILMINYLLTKMNHPDRVYYDYSGNDTECVLLSDKMKQILQMSGIITQL